MSSIDIIILTMMGIVFSITMTLFTFLGVRKDGRPNTFIWLITTVLVMLTMIGSSLIVWDYV
jgi:heme/copper-type cytochrome/quinol oxidase subunit 4